MKVFYDSAFVLLNPQGLDNSMHKYILIVNVNVYIRIYIADTHT